MKQLHRRRMKEERERERKKERKKEIYKVSSQRNKTKLEHVGYCE
jgi:hypothetical protein